MISRVFQGVVFATIVAILAGSVSALPVPQAWYKLEGDYTDASPNGYNASLYTVGGAPAPTWVTNPQNGTQAAWFGPHVGGQAQSIRTPGAVGNSATGLSICFWANMTAMAVDGGDDLYVAVNKGGDTAPNGFRVFLDQDSDRPYLRVNSTDYRGDNNGAVLPGTVNNWTHWGITYNPTTGRIDFYVNGAPQDNNTAPAGLSFDATPVDIGGKVLAGQYDEDFRGGLDDVMFWNATLTGAEMAEAYQLALLPEPASLILLGLGGLAMIRRRKA